MKVRPDVFNLTMEIKGKIYCFFEQSGTFKNEFRKLGYEAEDYDIQNEYGQTDHVCDLFAEIERGYDGKPSIFDNITPDDLILAFFPCIYFSQQNTTFFDGTNQNCAKKARREIANFIIEREREREVLHFVAQTYEFVRGQRIANCGRKPILAAALLNQQLYV